MKDRESQNWLDDERYRRLSGVAGASELEAGGARVVDAAAPVAVAATASAAASAAALARLLRAGSNRCSTLAPLSGDTMK